MSDAIAINKPDLVNTLAAQTGMTKALAAESVDILFDTIATEVAAGRKVKIHKFGVFSPKTRGAYVGRNPQTGAPVQVAASTKLAFKASKSASAST